MENDRRSEPLGQGGPSDQASQRRDPRDDGDQGAQSGRPQAQHSASEEGESGAPAGGGAVSRAPVRGDGEGMSDTERKAGTPDARATTDWRHGEGEPSTGRDDASEPSAPEPQPPSG
jgi:hypothetical protein